MPASRSSVSTPRCLRRRDRASGLRALALPLLLFLALPLEAARAQDVAPEECVALLRKLEQHQELTPAEQQSARICIDRIKSAPPSRESDDSSKRLPLKVFR